LPQTEISGVGLFYDEAGAGEATLFVHGIPTDYRAWAAQIGPFSEKYRTVTVSRRYAWPNVRQGNVLDSTVENNANDLGGLIQKLGIAPVHLIGHSYGGFVSAVLAREHPDLVKSLVLVEPAVSTMLLTDSKSRAQMLSLLIRSPSVALAARRFQTRSLYPSFRALDEGALERAAQLNIDGVQDTSGAFSHLPDEVKKMVMDNVRTVGELRTEFPKFTAEDAGKISCRTLVINGESSPLWLRRIGFLLSRSIPGAERTIVPGTRHFPHLENPSDFNSKVLGFLSRRD
jgi:pimeloyl-ACP methyl ester carboxylesterase